MLTIKIAELAIGIDNRFAHIERLSRDYVTDEPPLFVVSVTDEERRAEAARSSEEFSDGYLESTVAYRKIAEQLPKYDGFVFHGAVLAVDGVGYAFTARSGVGKTTHTRLWLSHFGKRAEYVNGDKPIIRFIDGVPYAFGTPWRGKESYGRNMSARLRGIALLARGEINRAERIDASEAVTQLLSQMYIPKRADTARMSLLLLNRLIASTDIIRLECNMEPDAPIVSARAFGIENI